MRLEQTVHISKGRGPRWNAIFQNQKTALPGTSGKNRGSNGDEMFLPRIGVNVHARQCIQNLGRVIGGDLCDCFGIDD